MAVAAVQFICFCAFDPNWLKHFKACSAGFCPFDKSRKLIFERKSVSAELFVAEMWWLRRGGRVG